MESKVQIRVIYGNTVSLLNNFLIKTQSIVQQLWHGHSLPHACPPIALLLSIL